MHGCIHIYGSLHMTIQVAVLIDMLKDLISDLHWFSWKIISTQNHTVAVIARDETFDFFLWKVETLKEYW